MNKKKRFRSDRVLSYFHAEWKVLLAVTLSGLIFCYSDKYMDMFYFHK